ncbi:hypothetical protein [Brevundimonas sp. M20]|uniref:hypothetical protein n=1 Tax=Brevundimonas sp. M20 TaxID=2591463 RepID=UPI001146AC17|nr:hypothetical protein [Brevundimonas sp. M20]QDH72613.1 hypothetical protein FKQ52_03695 [Brevundimonas sp. M20]
MTRLLPWPAIAAGALLLTACGENQVERDTRESRSLQQPTMEPEVTTGISSDGLPTMTRSMDFQTCLRTIQEMATDFGVPPTNIVETTGTRIVRFNTADGSVLVTCSAADRKLVAVQSPHRG